MAPRPDAFPNEENAKQRLAGRGIDAEASFRAFLQHLRPLDTDDVLDRLIADGNAEGQRALRDDAISRFDKYVGYDLGPSETETLRLTANGYDAKTVAKQRHLSVETVKTHLMSTRRKLEARNTAHAIAIAAVCGLLDRDSLGLRPDAVVRSRPTVRDRGKQ